MFDQLRFAKKLAALRKSRGFSQVDIAQALGVSDKTVSKWETGGSTPSLETLSDLADFYQESLPSLVHKLENQASSVPTIVITGGPRSGKTAVVDYLSYKLALDDFTVFRLNEIASSMIQSGLTPSRFKDPYEFQSELFNRQKEEEEKLLEAAEVTMSEIDDQHAVIICDRGLQDGRAYVSHAEFDRIVAAAGISKEELRDRYTGVVHLETMEKQPVSEIINPARLEEEDELLDLAAATKTAWSDVPTTTIHAHVDMDIKLREAENAVRSMLEMEALPNPPRPRRILVRRPKLEDFLDRSSASLDQVTVTFTQAINSSRQMLIKRKTHAEMQLTSVRINESQTGENRKHELEIPINGQAFSSYLEFADGLLPSVTKQTARFHHAGQALSLSFYDFLPYVAILEGEPIASAEKLELPPYLIEIRDVTDSDKFTDLTFAKALAEKLL